MCIRDRYVPEYQRLRIVKNQRFDIVDRHRVNRIYREALQDKIGQAVMLFRPAMVRDIDLVPGAWAGARVIWSHWDGYLRTEDMKHQPTVSFFTPTGSCKVPRLSAH